MTTTNLSCTVEPTDPSVPLTLEIWIDDQLLVHQNPVNSSWDFSYDLTEDGQEHELIFVLQNKSPGHTTVDAQGNIVKDALIKITNLTVDGINIESLLPGHAVYYHTGNGEHPERADAFFGVLGCNGRAVLKFPTPTYRWLLEHL